MTSAGRVMRARVRHLAPLWGTLAIGLACDPPTAPGFHVAGFYVTGFETSTFTACDAGEEWYLIGPLIGEITIRYFETVTSEFQPLYAEFRGTLSPPGRYGPQSQPREFRALEILEMRMVQPGDCGRPAATGGARVR